MKTESKVTYFSGLPTVDMPSKGKHIISRILFPVLSLMSRESSIKLGLVPIDDERVIMALKNVKGRVLDIGCGSNTFVRSYGNGVGVDVFEWEGCDLVIDDAAKLPFDDASFDSVSYLACLNHVSNRSESLRQAFRVTKPGGQIMVTMITPKMGAFIHWLRERNDPDHSERHIDHSNELLGMSAAHVKRELEAAGYANVRRKKFAYGLNSLYLADKPSS